MYIISKFDVIKIITPPLLACILFIVTLFELVIPESKNLLLDQKKNTIASLTQAAVNLLIHYNDLVLAGELSEHAAKTAAVRQLHDLRYGPENKDYFWVTDLQPRMIMHPYRPELEGQHLAEFRDPDGKKLFQEFVNNVAVGGSGYVPYLWQWKDHPDRIAPKLSYVKLFEPWGWIIGTGVYLDDVQREFSRTSRKLVYISFFILAMIFVLSMIIINQGIRETRKRKAAESELQQQNEQLEELVRLRTRDLEDALSKVKLLSGFIPICASCKKIRDDKGYWNQLETYLKQHSEAEFSHSICPDCADKLYPRLKKKR